MRKVRFYKNGSIYWNFHKHLYSLKDRPGGKVAARVHYLVVREARFVVSQNGRARSLRIGRKTQHADIRGRVEVVRDVGHPRGRGWIRVTYDHQQHATFVSVGDGRSVLAAEEVRMLTVDGRPKVYARGVTYG